MAIQLCEKLSIGITEISRRIGQSPLNSHKELKKNNVNLDELIEIADALGISYEQVFILPNGVQIKISSIEQCTIIE